MSFPSGLLETFFKNFVAQNGLEEGMDHLSDEPNLGNILERLHADVNSLLACGHDRRYR
jgi:hypothetical protein